MFYLFKKVHFLKNFSFAKIVLHVIFFNCFYSHLFTGKFVYTKSYFSEGTFTNQFYEFVEV